MAVFIRFRAGLRWAPLIVLLSCPCWLRAQFTLSLQPNPVNLPNSSGRTVANATVTPENGFLGGVNMTCVPSHSPAGATRVPVCAIGSGLPMAPPTLTITGKSAQSVQVTIFGPFAPMPATRLARSGGLWLPMVGALLMFLFSRFRETRRDFFALLAITVPIILTGCSSMNSNRLTPGVYTYEMTASSQQSPAVISTAELNVNYETP